LSPLVVSALIRELSGSDDAQPQLGIEEILVDIADCPEPTRRALYEELVRTLAGLHYE
jgi:hypothetical protein